MNYFDVASRKTITMKTLIRLYLALLFLTAASCGDGTTTEHTQRYEGAWFTIRYPAAFHVTPSLKNSTGEGYDSAFFYAPNGRVSFYVFAPQWGGTPSDIAIDKTTERLTTTKTSKSGDAVVRWYTIEALDGSYTRSYQQTDSADHTSRWIVGVRYATFDDFKPYRSAYKQFKQSLQRFAD